MFNYKDGIEVVGIESCANVQWLRFVNFEDLLLNNITLCAHGSL